MLCSFGLENEIIHKLIRAVKIVFCHFVNCDNQNNVEGFIKCNMQWKERLNLDAKLIKIFKKILFGNKKVQVVILTSLILCFPAYFTYFSRKLKL